MWISEERQCESVLPHPHPLSKNGRGKIDVCEVAQGVCIYNSKTVDIVGNRRFA